MALDLLTFAMPKFTSLVDTFRMPTAVGVAEGVAV